MDTSVQHQQQDLIHLPEINISNKDDWDFLSKPTVETSPPPTPPHIYQPTEHNTEDQESITTGLTRALSFSRQTANTLTEKEEDVRKEVINISTSNPSHLFWVPASQHPEIAPGEFEKYVDAHGLMIRKKSVQRRRSVLSVYFTASDQQKLLDELGKTDSVERDRQAAFDALENPTSQQTSLAGEDSRKKKMVLRRSVSLQSAGDYVRNVPDLLVFDRNSSPLDESRALVPKGDRPLLRRGARTNFKRNSSVTTSHRSPLTNRKSGSDEETNSLIRSPSVEGVTLIDNTLQSNSERFALTDEPSPLSPVTETEEVRDLCIASRSPEDPPSSFTENLPSQPITMTRSVSTSTTTTSNSSNTNNSHNRKSAWSWAFWSDEKSKKHNKINPGTSSSTNNATTEVNIVPEPTEEIIKSVEQPSSSSSSSSNNNNNKRFTLSSIFSRKSKNNHQSVYTTTNVDLNTSSSLLTKAPKDFELNRMYMTRLPLHVERAIYKLSHVKLANPRRPLHEQVLISNQMFWYLSVIATNNPQSQPSAMDIVEEKKKPRKRLVKKHQRPASAPPSSKKKQTATPSFMANKSASRAESTGFVVPDNYLNPNYQQQQPQPQSHQNRKTIATNIYARHDWDHHHGRYTTQNSDSSSDEDEGEDELLEQDEEDMDEVIRGKNQKEDDKPLSMYKVHPQPKIK